MGTKEGALKTKQIRIESYKNKLFTKLKLNNHTLLETYINSQTIIKFKCNKHNLIFKVRPTKYINKNQGCPLCSKTKSHNKETNYNKIYSFCLDNNLFLLSKEYKSSKVNLEIKCNLCKYSFLRTSSNLWKNVNCPNCINTIRDKQYLFNELKNLCKKDNYILLEDTYINAHSYIKVKCSNNHIYKTTSTTFKSGSRCQLCSYEKHPGVINFGTIEQEYLLKECFIYFIKINLKDEIFYKVGITNNIKKRKQRICKELKSDLISILFHTKGNYKNAFLLEQFILTYFKYFKYKPLKKFQGYTECLNSGVDLNIISNLFNNADALFLNSEKEGELLEYLKANQTTK